LVFLPALLDLLLEELRKRTIPQPLLASRGMVHDQIGDERPRKPPRLLLRVLHQERVHRTQRPRHPLRDRRDGSRGRGGGGGGGGGGRGGRGDRGGRRGRT